MKYQIENLQQNSCAVGFEEDRAPSNASNGSATDRDGHASAPSELRRLRTALPSVVPTRYHALMYELGSLKHTFNHPAARVGGGGTRTQPAPSSQSASHTTLNPSISPENGCVKLDVIHGSLPARPSTAYVGWVYFPVACEGSSDCPVAVKEVGGAGRPSYGIVVGHKRARGASSCAKRRAGKTQPPPQVPAVRCTMTLTETSGTDTRQCMGNRRA